MIFMFASNIGLTLKSYDAILVFILPQKEHAFKFYKVHLYLTGLSFRIWPYLLCGNIIYFLLNHV